MRRANRPAVLRGTPVMTDALFSSVKLLLPFNDANNATSTTDLSPSPKAITFAGSAVIKTARAKFGASGLEILGNGSLTAGAAADWKFLHDGTTAWALEGWMASDSLAGVDRVVIDTCGGSSTGIGVYLAISSSTSKFTWFIARGFGSSFVISTTINAQSGVFVSDGTPYFLRVTYDPAVTTAAADIRVNGVSLGTLDRQPANTPSASNPNYALRIGGLNPSGNQWNGGIDDFRITAAIRSGAIPTAAFPTS